MEQNSPFDSFELQITPLAQGFLKETAKWALFLSILGFIGLGFLILGGLSMIAAGSMIDSVAGGMGAMGMFSGLTLGLVYLVFAILYFFPIYYLYKFASNTKQALQNNNTEKLTSSLESLKSHYKFMGILAILMIVFYILFIVIFAATISGNM